MAWKGIKHTSVGEELDSSEWESDELHEIENGSTLPPTANDGDFFYKSDEHRLYIYKTD